MIQTIEGILVLVALFVGVPVGFLWFRDRVLYRHKRVSFKLDEQSGKLAGAALFVRNTATLSVAALFVFLPLAASLRYSMRRDLYLVLLSLVAIAGFSFGVSALVSAWRHGVRGFTFAAIFGTLLCGLLSALMVGSLVDYFRRPY